MGNYLEQQKVAIIYHLADGDGILSGLVMLDLFKYITGSIDQVKTFGYNYQKVLPFDNELAEFDKVIFIDVTPPLEWLENHFAENNDQQIWIFDHHEKAYNEIREKFLDQDVNLVQIFSKTDCAAMQPFLALGGENANHMLFNLFFQPEFNLEQYVLENSTTIDFVKEIDEYDTWKWWSKYDMSDVKTASPYINYWGLHKTINSEAKATKLSVDNYLKVVVNNGLNQFLLDNTELIIQNGLGIYDSEIDFSTKLRRLHKPNGLVLVGSKTNTFVTKLIEDTTKDVKLVIYYNVDAYNDPESCKISLRSIDLNVDVAQLAKNLFGPGSGGHKNAAGAYAKITKFFEIINNEDNFKNLPGLENTNS